MIRDIGESKEFPGLKIWGQQPETPNSPLPKPYSGEWWNIKGRIDRRQHADPQFPKVKPYMEGWHDVEDEDRDQYGSSDFMNE